MVCGSGRDKLGDGFLGGWLASHMRRVRRAVGGIRSISEKGAAVWARSRCLGGAGPGRGCTTWGLWLSVEWPSGRWRVDGPHEGDLGVPRICFSSWFLCAWCFPKTHKYPERIFLPCMCVCLCVCVCDTPRRRFGSRPSGTSHVAFLAFSSVSLK